MKIFPAIDIHDSKVSRLTQGDYQKAVFYPLSPREAAEGFMRAGAKHLHIVDLDGARDGALSAYEIISELVKDLGLFCEVGGGIRDEARVEKYLSLGVSRVILGTAAVKNPGFLAAMAKKYDSRIAVGVDVKDGLVATDGWLNVTQISGVEFCRRARDIGVGAAIYTDISRDGAMRGANIDIYRELAKIEGLEIVASGGVSSLEDVKLLREAGADAAIIGKALYLGAVDLALAIEEAEA